MILRSLFPLALLHRLLLWPRNVLKGHFCRHMWKAESKKVKRLALPQGTTICDNSQHPFWEQGQESKLALGWYKGPSSDTGPTGCPVPVGWFCGGPCYVQGIQASRTLGKIHQTAGKHPNACSTLRSWYPGREPVEPALLQQGTRKKGRGSTWRLQHHKLTAWLYQCSSAGSKSH